MPWGSPDGMGANIESERIAKNCEQAMRPWNEGIACRAGETDPLRRDANLSGTAMRQPDSATI
jgi:hypothetical protein